MAKQAVARKRAISSKHKSGILMGNTQSGQPKTDQQDEQTGGQMSVKLRQQRDGSKGRKQGYMYYSRGGWVRDRGEDEIFGTWYIIEDRARSFQSAGDRWTRGTGEGRHATRTRQPRGRDLGG